MRAFGFTKRWLVIFAVACAAVTTLFVPYLRRTFGPLTLHESQCLLCHRDRLENWVCGTKVTDSVSTNEYSNWMDALLAPTHAHLWLQHTGYYRPHWFGSTSIACGGVSVIPRIFEQRGKLGEDKARQLAHAWHALIAAGTPGVDNQQRLDAFTEMVRDNPEALLDLAAPAAGEGTQGEPPLGTNDH